MNETTIAYRCSECACLQDLDEIVMCSVGIDPRTNYREKGDAALCKKNFTLLPKEGQDGNGQAARKSGRQ